MGAVAGDRFLAAGVYAASNVLSWARALAVPAAQAVANLRLLDRQKEQYDDIAEDRKNEADMALANYCACIENLIPLIADAYDDVPEAAPYVPIDPRSNQRQVIDDNFANLLPADQYARCMSRLHQQSDIIRASMLDPRYIATLEIYSRDINSLMQGKVEVSDLREIMTDVAENAALLGRIGGVGSATTRALGISSARAKGAGRLGQRNLMGMLNRDVSPISRQSDIREMMHSPEFRMNYALSQAQLIQSSNQNILNANARKPPARLAELQFRLDKCVNALQTEMAKVNLGNSFVPNYAAALQPQVAQGADFIGSQISGALGRAQTKIDGVQQSLANNTSDQTAAHEGGDMGEKGVNAADQMSAKGGLK